MNAHDQTALFEEHLRQETLHSERMRATLIMIAMVILSLMLILFESLGTSEFIRMLRNVNALNSVIALQWGMILYELFVRYMIGRHIRRNTNIPVVIRFFNSFVETSLPTVAMILSAQTLGPIYALNIAAPLAYFVFIVLSALRLEFWLCVFTGFVAGAEYLTLALVFLSQTTDASLNPVLTSPIFYAAKGVLLFVVGLGAGFVTLQIRKRLIRSFHAVEERNAAVRLFGQHVSPAVVNELLSNKADLSTTRKHVCVMFVDIRGFTRFAEKRTPEEMVSYLNTMFEFMIESVNKNHGIVHQLLGDGLMAIFGAPMSFGNDSENAVMAATEIIDQMGQAISGGKIPPTRVGVGLHAGEVVAGSVGSTIHKEYKVTGDVVNVASRIEQLNKQFESQLLVSGEVLRKLEKKREAVSLGPVPMKGREEPVEIYMLAR